MTPRTQARPFIRFLATIMVACALFGTVLVGKKFWVSRDGWLGFQIWLFLFIAYGFANVAMTGRWLWRLPDERWRDRKSR